MANFRKMRVYYPNPHAEAVYDGLAASGFEMYRGDPPGDYDALIEGRPEDGLMEAQSLRLVIVPFAGVPIATIEKVKARPHISLHNLHHNAADTAELALALLLSAGKLVVPMDQRLRQNNWGSRYEESKVFSFEGKTALVLGYGEIGKRISRALRVLGMRVIAVRRRAGSADDGIEIRGIDELHALLPEANVLMIALPQTPETTGLIKEEELKLMPRGSILVNIARGPIVDEEALYKALESGHLHSAGLDVWYNYPSAASNTVPGYQDMPDSALNTPPSKFPFGELENVVMSPHRGGTSMDTEKRRVEHLARILKAFEAGEEPPNKVDLKLGY